MSNNYHRYIKLPFDFIKPSETMRTMSSEQEEKTSIWDTEKKGKTDVYKFNIPELNENVKSFLDEYDLFYNTKLMFYTSPKDRINIHVDSNKDANYLNDTQNYFDNHVKLNYTWENEKDPLAKERAEHWRDDLLYNAIEECVQMDKDRGVEPSLD